jgi:hypothetical protein
VGTISGTTERTSVTGGLTAGRYPVSTTDAGGSDRQLSNMDCRKSWDRIGGADHHLSKMNLLTVSSVDLKGSPMDGVYLVSEHLAGYRPESVADLTRLRILENGS